MILSQPQRRDWPRWSWLGPQEGTDPGEGGLCFIWDDCYFLPLCLQILLTPRPPIVPESPLISHPGRGLTGPEDLALILPLRSLGLNEHSNQGGNIQKGSWSGSCRAIRNSGDCGKLEGVLVSQQGPHKAVCFLKISPQSHTL